MIVFAPNSSAHEAGTRGPARLAESGRDPVSEIKMEPWRDDSMVTGIADLLEILSLVPGTHARYLTSVCAPNYEGVDPLVWPLRTCEYM